MRPLLLFPAVLLAFGSIPAPTTGPRCPYPQQPAATRQLLQQLDQQLPRAVGRASTGTRRYCRALFVLDSCFVARSVAGTFPAQSHQLEARLSRGLTTRFVKRILDTGSIQVLEYGSSAGAQAAQMVMDSLVRSCRGRSWQSDERCIGTDMYQVARRGNCLVRFSAWVEDPLLRTALNQVKVDLLGP